MTEPESLLTELREHLVCSGAKLVGAADLTAVSADACDGLPRGLAMGVALQPEIVEEIDNGPTESYSLEYERVNGRLNELSEWATQWLTNRGYKASYRPITTASVDETSLSTPLPHKTVARLAGLGWIGKCALLVTEGFGTAVRYGTVLTDAPLQTGRAMERPLCGNCTACVEVCPVAAPSGREWVPGMKREEFFDAKKCLHQTTQWSKTLPPGHQHQICGMCITVCPFTRRYLNKKQRKTT